MISWNELSTLARGHVPGQVIIQMTDQCNARCPQCEMRVTERYDRSDLAVDEMKRVIDAAAARRVPVLSFTGGEPLLRLDELCELIKHAGQAGIRYIRTGTNGYHFARPDSPKWHERVSRVADMLAETPVRNFWISVDSADETTHEQMRGFQGLIRGFEKALPMFHERGLYPSANLGLNRRVGGAETWDLAPDGEIDEAYLDEFESRFERALDRFYRLVVDLGFTIVNCCYPMSVPEQSDTLLPVYAATSADRIVRFDPRERVRLYRALSNVIPRWRSKIRIFSPLASLHSLQRQHEGHTPEFACRGGTDFFFIDSRDGNTYPCGYRGSENLGKFWDIQRQNLPKAHCTDCDWECFRDPSDMFGPVIEGLRTPWKLVGRFRDDREFVGKWWRDLRYYGACEYFDGRRPPNWLKLQRFAADPAGPGPVTEAAPAEAAAT